MLKRLVPSGAPRYVAALAAVCALLGSAVALAPQEDHQVATTSIGEATLLRQPAPGPGLPLSAGLEVRFAAVLEVAREQNAALAARLVAEAQVAAELEASRARAIAEAEAAAQAAVEAREAARTPDPPPAPAPAPQAQAQPVSAHLQAIARCESGGDPGAISASGTYRGKYQFDRRTWRSVGGTGDPAAASEAEQDRRAARLYAKRGAQPWPTCG